MIDAIKSLVKQPFWVIALVAGVLLVALPCITIDKDFHLATHPPSTNLLVVIGISILVLSFAAFGLNLWLQRPRDATASSDGLDLTRVRESSGALCTTVNGCEIRVVNGRIEDYAHMAGLTVALPCNEYFDDRCVGDTSSALGAFVNRAFDGQAAEFVSLMKEECRRKLGTGVPEQKTEDERAESFGAGRCILLLKPLGRAAPVALISTTTQRAGYGLAGRISYLFDGMRELVTRLADARLNDVAMPLLGAGHGRIGPPLALVGLLLAVAEAARYGQGGQRLKRVTVVLFKRDESSPAEVDPLIVRRALALIGSQE